MTDSDNPRGFTEEEKAALAREIEESKARFLPKNAEEEATYRAIGEHLAEEIRRGGTPNFTPYELPYMLAALDPEEIDAYCRRRREGWLFVQGRQWAED